MSATKRAVRRWFVTGASSGTGRQLVERVLGNGDRVVATVRRPDALADLQTKYGDALQVELLDLRDLDAIDGVVERAAVDGPVDVVVNNAGYTVIGALEELTDQEIDDQLRTMLHGPIKVTRAFIPVLRANGGGHIVQISSVSGQTGLVGASVMSAAKAGLEGVTEVVAQEVAQFGIRCTIIEPSMVRSGYRRAIQFATELPPYATGPVADMRALSRQGDEIYLADPAKLAAVVVEVTTMPDPPLRLALGVTAIGKLTTAFESRADNLRQFEQLTRSVAFDDNAIVD